MKYLFKYLIKLLFVVIVPILLTIAVVNLFVYQPWSTVPSVCFVILCLLSYVNSFFYTIHMSKTYLLPSIKLEGTPGIGVYLEQIHMHWELKLPLCTLVFRRRRK